MPMTPEEAQQHWLRITGKLSKIIEGSFEHSKPLKSSYWKELLDVSHRPTTELSRLLVDFKKEKRDCDFFEWITKIPPKHQVAYLKESDRENYAIGFSGKKLIFSAMVKEFASHLESGSQEIIFVLAAQQIFYGGVKSIGEFHHSSFLSGAPVAGAGTFFLENGEIVKVSDHSGHYVPGIKEMIAVLKAMNAQGADLSSIEVSVRIGTTDVCKSALAFIAEHAPDASSSSSSSSLMAATPRVHAAVAASASSNPSAASAAAAAIEPTTPLLSILP
jgi:hypothetical protein